MINHYNGYIPYTGIGSRDIPIGIAELFINIGEYLGKRKFTLRSGGANGSDLSFEIGCDKSNGRKEIYIPWYRFNGSDSMLFKIKDEAYKIAKEFHPNWDNLDEYSKKLHARNVSQILGGNLKTPTCFVICYTKEGKMVGGTSQALRIAKAYNIPIFNVGDYKDIKQFKIDLFSFIKSNWG